MKRLSILLLVIVSIALPAAAQTKGNAKDEEAIKGITFKWQEAWNLHDIKALAALVAEDVDFITVGGAWQKNRKEFAAFHTQRHEMQFKESIWTTKKTTVEFIKSDVAVAHVEWGIVGDKDPDGTPRPPRRGIFTWVLEKRKGAWTIIASQNTNIREPLPNN